MVRVYVIILLLNISFISNAQLLTEDEIKLTDKDRINQLLQDSLKQSISYFYRSTSLFQTKYTKIDNKIKIKYLSFSYEKQTNNNLPYGFNDGSFFQARGLQERYSAGMNVRWNILDINFQPEFVNVENQIQEEVYGDLQDRNYWTRYFYQVANNIDNFRQFGNKPINYSSMGQSRIGIATNSIGIGYSNENIWWGPGMRNSLIFSNNAPGFSHYYLQTTRPLKTILGDFELNAIIGKLDSLKYTDPDIPMMNSIWTGAIINKKLNERNIHSISVNLKPKWLSNLYLGYAYSTQSYINDMNATGVFYSNFSKDKPKMSLGAISFRFLLPKDHVEFYGELGITNQRPWQFNIFSDTTISGFNLGARKLFPTKNNKSNFELSIELTQLSIMDPRNIFVSGSPFGVPKYNSWYTSSIIRQGYTNQGQLLGASIGPGSNSQTINFSWNKCLNKIGFYFERITNNNDFYHYHYISGSLGYSKADAYWVDINNGAYIRLNPTKNLLVLVSYANTLAMNYRWIKNWRAEEYAQPGINSDKSNLQFNFSIKYLLNANH